MSKNAKKVFHLYKKEIIKKCNSLYIVYLTSLYSKKKIQYHVLVLR